MAVKMDTGKVTITVEEWSQLGGIDSLQGRGKAEVEAEVTIAADGRTLIKKIKEMIKKNHWLEMQQHKEFTWRPAWSSKNLKGLTIGNAQATIDAQVMDEATWKAKWIKAPKPKATGGPFAFTSKTTDQEALDAMRAQGHPAGKVRGMYSQGREKRMYALTNGRKWKQLYRLLDASTSKMSKERNDDGWEVFSFKFGRFTVYLYKHYIGYPVNGMKWVVLFS
jgi:hypothetical protein